jgi:surface protein
MSNSNPSSETNNFYADVYNSEENKDEVSQKMFGDNPPISTIKDNKSKNETKTTDILENYKNKIYICEKCGVFPIIRKYNNKIHIICKETNHAEEVEIKIFIGKDFKEKKDEDKKYKYCKHHKDKLLVKACVNCKQNLCEDCKHDKNHTIKDFKDLDKDCDYLIKGLKEYFKSNFKCNTEKEEHNPNCISGGMSSNKKKEVSVSNTIVEKNIEEVDIANHFIPVLISNLNSFPSYSHYENVKHFCSLIGERLELTYGIKDNKKDSNLKIRLLGKEFVEKNKKNCSLIINGEIEELKEEYQLPDKNTKLNVILLKENDNMTDMSYMFYDCENLLSISEESKWNTDKITDLSYMFYNCASLEKLTKDLENLDTSSVKNMTYMFSGCKLLSKLNVKKWQTDKLEDMGYLFNECKNLEHIIGISEWDTSKVENMCYLFSDCLKLQELKDIFKWNTGNVKDMSNMFNNCNGLKILSNSKGETWDTKNVTNMGYMFNGCKSLKEFPENIFKKGENKWDTSKVQYMSYMFGDCETIEELPNNDIESWDTQNVLKMNNMFENCSALKKLPNIIKWNISKLDDIYEMIEGCDSLKEEELPDFSKWKDKKIVYTGGAKFKKFFG